MRNKSDYKELRNCIVEGLLNTDQNNNTIEFSTLTDLLCNRFSLTLFKVQSENQNLIGIESADRTIDANLYVHAFVNIINRPYSADMITFRQGDTHITKKKRIAQGFRHGNHVKQNDRLLQRTR